MYGYDIVEAAIRDARRNAADNGISNATFVTGDLEQLARGLIADLEQSQGSRKAGKTAANSKSNSKSNGSRQKSKSGTVDQRPKGGVSDALLPGVVVVDPARAGLASSVVQFLLACGARRLVYVRWVVQYCFRVLAAM